MYSIFYVMEQPIIDDNFIHTFKYWFCLVRGFMKIDQMLKIFGIPLFIVQIAQFYCIAIFALQFNTRAQSHIIINAKLTT